MAVREPSSVSEGEIIQIRNVYTGDSGDIYYNCLQTGFYFVYTLDKTRGSALNLPVAMVNPGIHAPLMTFFLCSHT